MKTNKEIVIEELKKIHGEYMVAKALATQSGEYYKNQDKWRHKFFEPLAENLLSKLNKLDRENVEEIIMNFARACGGSSILISRKENFIDQILSLIPEEGEVIARGIARAYPSGFEIGNNTLSEINQKIFAYENQNIKIIIIREVK